MSLILQKYKKHNISLSSSTFCITFRWNWHNIKSATVKWLITQVACSTFRMLCNHLYIKFQNISSPQKGTSHRLSSCCPVPTAPGCNYHFPYSAHFTEMKSHNMWWHNSAWLLSHSIILSRFSHGVSRTIISLISMVWVILHMWNQHDWLTHPPTHRRTFGMPPSGECD